MNNRQTGSAKLTLAILLGLACVLAIAVTLLPKGFKDDLSLIGQGNVSVVLTHDKNLVGSTHMMELLNTVRPDYEGRVEFLAVDTATPVGQKFVHDQRVGVVNLVIFDPQGKRQSIVNGGIDEQQLRRVLDDATTQ